MAILIEFCGGGWVWRVGSLAQIKRTPGGPLTFPGEGERAVGEGRRGKWARAEGGPCAFSLFGPGIYLVVACAPIQFASSPPSAVTALGGPAMEIRQATFPINRISNAMAVSCDGFYARKAWGILLVRLIAEYIADPGKYGFLLAPGRVPKNIGYIWKCGWGI